MPLQSGKLDQSWFYISISRFFSEQENLVSEPHRMTRKKRMDLGLQIKELARLVHVTSDTAINWGLRNVKPVGKNLTMVKRFLDSDGRFRCLAPVLKPKTTQHQFGDAHYNLKEHAH